MRADLLFCNLKTCRYCSDGNCTETNKYSTCDYTIAKEKQIPKKVTDIHVDEYYCPNCGAENIADQGKVPHKYCPNCGQLLESEV